MKVHKFTVTFTRNPSQPITQNVSKSLRDHLVSYSGITPVQQYSTQNNDAYESYTLNGGQEQLAFYNMYGQCILGAIENGHTPFVRPGTYDFFMKYSAFSIPGSRTTYFVADDNNNILGIKADAGGWIFFYRDTDGVRIAFQDATADNYANYIGNRMGGILVGHSGSVIKGGEYIFSGYAQCPPFNIETQISPGNGKILKFATLQSDQRMGYNVEREYPISMYDGDQAWTPRNVDITASTLFIRNKKIQIDGQKYIHLGGFAWIPYTTITETNITV